MTVRLVSPVGAIPLPRRVHWSGGSFDKIQYEFLAPSRVLVKSGLVMRKDLPKEGDRERFTSRGRAFQMKTGKIRLTVQARCVIARDLSFQAFLLKLLIVKPSNLIDRRGR
jgi:hypothetical protein